MEVGIIIILIVTTASAGFIAAVQTARLAMYRELLKKEQDESLRLKINWKIQLKSNAVKAAKIIKLEEQLKGFSGWERIG